MKRTDRLEDLLGVRLSVFDKKLDGALGKELKKDN